jgi:hypothetical protein
MFQIEKHINISTVVTPAKKKTAVWSIFQQMGDDAHVNSAAGFLLDPEYTDMAQTTNEEIMTGFYGLVEQLIPDVGQQVLITNQLTKFRSKQGIFGGPIAIAPAKTLPAYQWWSNFGAAGPEP